MVDPAFIYYKFKQQFPAGAADFRAYCGFIYFAGQRTPVLVGRSQPNIVPAFRGNFFEFKNINFMENQNQPQPEDLKNPEGALKPAEKPAAQAAPKILEQPKPAVSEEYSFYNVMPKISVDNRLAEPQIKPAEQLAGQPAPAAGDPALLPFWKKYLKYLVIGAVIAIGGPAAYFAAQYFGKVSYEPENQLLNNIGTPNTPAATGNNPDNDVSSLPEFKAWQAQYFASEDCDENTCGANADADHDGMLNSEEFRLGTDPNNSDSDNDGLADGDEHKVFQTNPLDAHTAKDPQYNDAAFINGGYSIQTGNIMTEQEKTDLSLKMNALGLHSPTVVTLINSLGPIYNFNIPKTEPAATSTPPAAATTSPLTGIDVSLAAKQERDAQRSTTIKNLEIALVKYFDDNKTFPKVTSVQDVYQAIRPYLKVALNPIDPINKDVYVYGYTVTDSGDDFTLSFFSESAGQVIKKNAEDARKDRSLEEAGIYDDQRKNDLESLRSALLVYSSKNATESQTYVFPTVEKYKVDLVPELLNSIPKDPKTQQDYQYQVSDTFDSFTLKAVLDNPPVGTTGFLCNQEECRNY